MAVRSPHHQALPLSHGNGVLDHSAPPAASIPDPDTLLKAPAVAGLVGVSVATLYRWERESFPGWPASIKLSARCTRWRYRDVLAFLRAQGASN